MITVEDAYLEALVWLERQTLPEACQHDLLAALAEVNPGPLPLVVRVCADAGLARDDGLRRAVPVLFFSAAGNLADDLGDGDCDYLDARARLGPSTQMILQNLFAESLLDAGIGQASVTAALRTLTEAVGLQHIEIRTSRWTTQSFLSVAEGISGLQWAGYLQILWAGTPLGGNAHAIGRSVGIVGHIASDIETGDVRYTSLSAAHRKEVLDRGATLIGELRDHDLECLRPLFAWSESIFSEAVR